MIKASWDIPRINHHFSVSYLFLKTKISDYGILASHKTVCLDKEENIIIEEELFLENKDLYAEFISVGDEEEESGDISLL